MLFILAQHFTLSSQVRHDFPSFKLLGVVGSLHLCYDFTATLYQGGSAVEPLPLVSGRDYPNTYREFVEMFPNDSASATFLAKLRWPDDFVCPACKGKSVPWQTIVAA